MADVTPPGDGGDVTPWGGDAGATAADRGQLFLVGAISLAVLFVALALFLNTAIYTENLATRTTNTGSGSAVQFHGEVEGGVGGVVGYANYHNATDNGTLYESVSNGTVAWVESAAMYAAVDGQAVNGTLVAVRNGTRITQNATRNFTSSAGSGNEHNWTVVESTASVRNFTMTVDPTKLRDEDLTGILGTQAFRVNLSDPASSDAWRVLVYDDLTTSELHVAVATPGGTQSCAAYDYASGERVTIDLTAHTVAGTSCPALDVFGDLPTNYDVHFNESQNVGGTYTLVVPKGGPAFDTTPYAGVGTGKSPYAVPAVYGATVNVTYRSGDTYYRTNATVAPGEADA